MVKEKIEQKEISPELIEKVNNLVERLEKANIEAARLQHTDELGGESEAGTEKPKEVPLTPQEYALKVQCGEIDPLA